MLGSINFVGTIASLPYTSLNGVCLCNIFTVVLYAHRVARILLSQLEDMTFVSPFSSILLNASTVLLACG